MRVFSKFVLTFVTVAAVAVMQLFGISAGYLCECRADIVRVAQSECDASDCHPGNAHADQQKPGRGENPEHQHKELRDAAKIARGAAPSVLVPQLPAADLPAFSRIDPMPAAAFRPVAPLSHDWGPGRSPPAAGIVVARTMVMLV